MRSASRARSGAKAILVALLVAALTTAIGPNAAADDRGSPAAPGAWACGITCTGQDPATFQVSSPYGVIKCGDDAITAKQSNLLYGLTLQLRYSPRCRTVWARAFGGSGGGDNTYVLFLRDNYGTYYPTFEYWPDNSGGRNWGYMVDDADKCTAALIGHDWYVSTIFGWTACY